jgi:hypothetical protein
VAAGRWGGRRVLAATALAAWSSILKGTPTMWIRDRLAGLHTDLNTGEDLARPVRPEDQHSRRWIWSSCTCIGMPFGRSRHWPRASASIGGTIHKYLAPAEAEGLALRAAKAAFIAFIFAHNCSNSAYSSAVITIYSPPTSSHRLPGLALLLGLPASSHIRHRSHHDLRVITRGCSARRRKVGGTTIQLSAWSRPGSRFRLASRSPKYGPWASTSRCSATASSGCSSATAASIARDERSAHII